MTFQGQRKYCLKNNYTINKIVETLFSRRRLILCPAVTAVYRIGSFHTQHTLHVAFAVQLAIQNVDQNSLLLSYLLDQLFPKGNMIYSSIILFTICEVRYR